MVAEVVDAVVGVDTHRDTHDAEIATPTGVPIARIEASARSFRRAWERDRSAGQVEVPDVRG